MRSLRCLGLSRRQLLAIAAYLLSADFPTSATVGQRFGISGDAIRMRLSRARKILARHPDERVRLMASQLRRRKRRQAKVGTLPASV
jgi:hypothetical protein